MMIMMTVMSMMMIVMTDDDDSDVNVGDNNDRMMTMCCDLKCNNFQ